ncbi:hypothetical protein [Dyadobacter aurulentus]|uniref:hypothetical protein n=1 Tax=Dyadobacter sp. UC 10 TaxID=2605428 RepID=UPI0011F32D34|nr:hypothetical protein [Dyadobacter sp. UC 10]KAA0989246.1 hypothetical protein FXO21_03260 [Dyadobacter sp. UC 10]
MKMKSGTIILFLALLGNSCALYAQERFYFRNGNTFPHRIVEANDKEIKFLEPKGDATIRRGIDRENVVVAFNAHGLFIVIKDLSPDPEISRKSLEKFYNATGPSTDLLIKSTPIEVIPATIRMENDAINYLTEDNKPASINKNDLVAIIYQDGRHQLLKDAEEAENLLSAAADKVLKYSKPASRRSNVPPAKVAAAPQPISEKAKQPVLSEQEYKEYRQKSITKVEQFSDYLQVIVDRSFSMNERDLAIKNALQLFLPETQIEVSSKNKKGVTKLPLEMYLKRLKMLPYGNVQIKWSQIEYVSELKQEQDGNYYGTIVGNQTFTGYGEKNQNILYSDITKKSVRVKLEAYQKEIDGQSKTNWTVLLGNIGVVADE